MGCGVLRLVRGIVVTSYESRQERVCHFEPLRNVSLTERGSIGAWILPPLLLLGAPPSTEALAGNSSVPMLRASGATCNANKAFAWFDTTALFCKMTDKTFCVVGLFAEGLISNGSIVDSGANLGEWSCLYAAAAPSRTVHAIEPVALNVKHIQRTYTKDFPNIKPRVGALGSAAATFLPPPNILLETRAGSMVTSDNMGRRLNASARAGTFSVLRLDDVFSDETLGFAHLDVEGGELEALRGGAAVMARDRCAAHDARTARTPPTGRADKERSSAHCTRRSHALQPRTCCLTGPY